MTDRRKITGKIVIAFIILSVLLFAKFSYGITDSEMEEIKDMTTSPQTFIEEVQNRGYSYIYYINTNTDSESIYVLDKPISENVVVTGDNARIVTNGYGQDTLNWHSNTNYDNYIYYMNGEFNSTQHHVYVYQKTDTTAHADAYTNKDSNFATWTLNGDDYTINGMKLSLSTINGNYETNNMDIKEYLENHPNISNVNYTGIIPTIIEKPTQSQIDNWYDIYVRDKNYKAYKIISHRPVDETGNDYIRHEYFRVKDLVLPYSDESIYSNGDQYSGSRPIEYLDHTGYMGTDLDGLRYFHPGADELISIEEYTSDEVQDVRPLQNMAILDAETNISITELPDDDTVVRVRVISTLHDTYQYYDTTIQSSYDYTEVATNDTYTEWFNYDYGSYSRISKFYDIDLSTSDTGYFLAIHGENQKAIQFNNNGQLSFFEEGELENLLNPDNNTVDPSYDPNAPDSVLAWMEYFGNLILKTFSMLREGIMAITYEIQATSKLLGILFSEMPPFITALIMVSLVASLVKILRG